MSPLERVQHAVCMQVHASAFQILTLGRVANHDDVYIKHVIDSIWGLKWNDLTPQTQRANNYFVRQAYQDMLDSYLPKLRKHLEETEGILKQHSARLAGLVFLPDKSQEEKIRDEGAKLMLGDRYSQEEKIRDEGAKLLLGDRYDTYKQGLEHVVKRRAEGPLRKKNDVNMKVIGTDINGKKECPGCDKTFTAKGLSRHYRQIHVQDVRRAIYCPENDCGYMNWGEDASLDEHLLKKHNQVLNKKRRMGMVKAKSRATKPAALEDQEDKQDEQAEQGEDGGGARGNETVDLEMADEDPAEDCILVADTSDEDSGNLST